MSSGSVDACDAALFEFKRVAKDLDTGITMALFPRLEKLLSTTERLIAECRRAQDEGDWA